MVSACSVNDKNKIIHSLDEGIKESQVSQRRQSNLKENTKDEQISNLASSIEKSQDKLLLPEEQLSQVIVPVIATQSPNKDRLISSREKCMQKLSQKALSTLTHYSANNKKTHQR